MKVDKAIKTLEDYIFRVRNFNTEDIKEIQNDFDKFCEEKCIAIETVLAELAKKNYKESEVEA